MDFNIEQLKKKIIYRSNYRGTKEMDKLLGAFTRKYIDKLDIKELNELEKLLNIDDNNLYNFYNGLKTEIIFKENKINSLFKNFKYNQ
jgi:antitoxin CptB